VIRLLGWFESCYPSPHGVMCNVIRSIAAVSFVAYHQCWLHARQP
jgi:hypothetical protein